MYDKFSVHATPTILFANADGEEVDRVIGYGPPANKFKDKLEAAVKSEDTFLKLNQAMKSNPNDLRVLAKLAEKYKSRYDNKTAREYADKILAQPDQARKFEIEVGDRKVTVYEYARFLQATASPDKLLAFLDEFPQSGLHNNVIETLNNFFSRPDKKQETFATYRTLMPKYPDDPDLLTGYLAACIELKEDIDQGIATADKFFQTHSQNLFFSNRLNPVFADLLLLQGDEKRALQVYGPLTVTRALKESPEQLNEYAWFWAQKGKNLTDAEAAARRSLKLKDEAYAWDTLSMVLWKQGKHVEAITAEEKALQMVGGKKEDYEKRIKEIKESQGK